MSKIKQKTSYFLLISFIFLLSCGGFKEVGKVLRNEKTNSTDEFLVKKNKKKIKILMFIISKSFQNILLKYRIKYRL